MGHNDRSPTFHVDESPRIPPIYVGSKNAYRYAVCGHSGSYLPTITWDEAVSASHWWNRVSTACKNCKRVIARRQADFRRRSRSWMKKGATTARRGEALARGRRPDPTPAAQIPPSGA